jgi:hypothetical protein
MDPLTLRQDPVSTVWTELTTPATLTRLPKCPLPDTDISEPIFVLDPILTEDAKTEDPPIFAAPWEETDPATIESFVNMHAPTYADERMETPDPIASDPLMEVEPSQRILPHIITSDPIFAVAVTDRDRPTLVLPAMNVSESTHAVPTELKDPARQA